MFSSCLSRSDRETIEIPPAPVGEAAVTPTAVTPQSVPETPAPATYSLDDAVKYVVQPGDTLSGIAGKHGVSVRAVMTANQLSDANKIRSGQTLLLPATDAGAVTASEPVGGDAAVIANPVPTPVPTPAPVTPPAGGDGLNLPGLPPAE